MAWASRSGHARVSSSSPEAFGVCQRCGFWYQRRELRNQMAWRGAAILPTWIFVCHRCYDTPNEQDRAVVWPADPVPIQLALPEDFDAASSTVMALAGSTIDPQTGIPAPNPTAMSTTTGVVMTPTPVGRPPGYDALDRAPVTPNDVVVFMAETGGTFMAQVDGVYMATEQNGGASGPASPVPPLPDNAQAIPITYGAPLPVLSLVANGTPLVNVSCSAPHGLALNDQVLVRGSLEPLADGLFSVIPLTATAFSYGTYSPVPAGSILGENTIVVTALVGLPRGYPAAPQTGLTASQIPPTKTSQ